MEESIERTELQSVQVIHLPIDMDYDELYFPVIHGQLRDLIGDILTQIESMNLPTQTERANKAIFTQMCWRWWNKIMENSTTSSLAKDGKPCIAPIKVVDCGCRGKIGEDNIEACTQCNVDERIRLSRVDSHSDTPINK
jgi:hypothetical protein